jgi:cytochrome c oxidase subunit 2
MIGKVTAMEPAAFQTWLAGGKATGTMADLGAKLFTDLGCATCHMDSAQGRGPSLKGVFGSQVALASGDKVVADEAYVRESILTPTAKMVAGFPPLMPTFQGVVSEEQIAQLTAYIKSLATTSGTPAATGAPGAPAAAATAPQAAGH